MLASNLIGGAMLQKGRKQTNKLPGEADSRAYLAKMRLAADHGDINAMGWLVFLAKSNKQAKQA